MPKQEKSQRRRTGSSSRELPVADLPTYSVDTVRSEAMAMRYVTSLSVTKPATETTGNERGKEESHSSHRPDVCLHPCVQLGDPESCSPRQVDLSTHHEHGTLAADLCLRSPYSPTLLPCVVSSTRQVTDSLPCLLQRPLCLLQSYVDNPFLAVVV